MSNPPPPPPPGPSGPSEPSEPSEPSTDGPAPEPPPEQTQPYGQPYQPYAPAYGDTAGPAYGDTGGPSPAAQPGQPYAYPPAAPGGYPGAARPGNPLAGVSLGLGIAALLFTVLCGLFSAPLSIGGLVCGFLAMRKQGELAAQGHVSSPGGQHGPGRGMALAGLICSGIALLLAIGLGIFLGAVLFNSGSTSP